MPIVYEGGRLIGAGGIVCCIWKAGYSWAAAVCPAVECLVVGL